jgi:2-keto-4-pentenoate hydratase/2-oxohepta-3-ene-1,7-dioic acid hydratase in catechol pathway
MTRLLTYLDDDTERLGCMRDGKVLEVPRVLAAGGLAPTKTLESYISAGPDHWAAAERLLADASQDGLPIESLALRPPLRPGAVICGGANFHDHLKETGRQKPERIEFFFKLPSAVVGPCDDVRMDRTLSNKYDYEVELGVVIGRWTRNVSAEQALDHVFGYLVLNDVSIRDHQIVLDDDGTSHGRFGQGKNFQDACPIGPWVVTASEIGDPSRLRLETRVEGQLRQSAVMSDAIWSVPEQIAYYSTHLTLQPGWIIATGTPGGPGLGSDEELRARPHALPKGVQRGGYVQSGQLVECRIDGIGALLNRYVVHEDGAA